MKEFMMIFIGSNYGEMNLSPAEMQSRMGQWWAWQDKMEKAGVLVNGHALHPEVKRVAGEARTVTDHTSVELKELVGGYYIVKAETADEVVKIAQDYPDYDLGGTVEIRQIMVFER